jgi:hypothetical protein
VSKKKKKSAHGSTLDSLLSAEGVLHEFNAIAENEVFVWRTSHSMTPAEAMAAVRRGPDAMRRARLQRIAEGSPGVEVPGTQRLLRMASAHS